MPVSACLLGLIRFRLKRLHLKRKNSCFTYKVFHLRSSVAIMQLPFNPKLGLKEAIT